MASKETKSEPGALPDVEIGASFKAKSLRFEQTPEVDVKVQGHGGREPETHSERENLPDEVEPGVTYRDVRVRWRAAARIEVEEPGEKDSD